MHGSRHLEEEATAAAAAEAGNDGGHYPSDRDQNDRPKSRPSVMHGLPQPSSTYNTITSNSNSNNSNTSIGDSNDFARPAVYIPVEPVIAQSVGPARAKVYSKEFWILWLGILVLATAISLDVQTVPQFQSYALSALGGSAWLASFSGIANFVNATARPPIARLATRYGNFNLFSGLIIILVVGFLFSASSQSIGIFAVGQCLTSLGQVGIQFAQNIIVAENSALPNRGLATALPMSPFAFTVFAVAPISEALLPDKWRLGYGLWALIVPAAAIPLLIHLWSSERAHRRSSPAYREPPRASSEDFDVTGLVLFATSLSLVFFSTTPPSTTLTETLQPPAFMIGVSLLFIFVYHQLVLAPIPILALRFLGDRTVFSGCTVTFLYFLSFSIYQPYLYPYFTIAEDLSISAATNASLIFMFSSTTFGLIASLALKYTKRYKWLATSGTFVRLMGSLTMLLLTLPTTGKWATYGYQAFAGAGMGMGSWVVQVGVQAAVSPKDVGALLALYATFGSFGGFLGDAFASAIFSPTLTGHLREMLPDSINNEEWIRAIRESVLVARSFERGTPERTAIDESWASTMRTLHIWSFGALALACIAVWGMRNLSLEDTSDREEEEDSIKSKDSDEASPLLP